MAGPQLIQYNASELPIIPLPDLYSCRSIEDTFEASLYEAGGNVCQRVSFETASTSQWLIIIPALTLTQRQSLRAFFQDRKGIVLPFKWTSVIDNTLRYMRFVDKSIKYTQWIPLTWKTQFYLSEVNSYEINLEG